MSSLWHLPNTGPGPLDYDRVWNRTGTELAMRTGGWRHCQMTSCNGVQVGLRWPNRRITWACVKGLIQRPDGDWQVVR